MTQLLTPGQNTYMNIRRAPHDGEPGEIVFVVLVTRDHEGVSLTFDHHDILNRAFTNLDEGRAYLDFLKTEAAAGTELWLIVERVGAWTSAAAAMSDAERNLVDGINAAMDGRTSELTAGAASERAAVADIRADVQRTGGWTGARTAAKNTALYPRRVRPTRTNVHVKPLSPAMLDLIRNHRDGVVTTRPGQSWTVLRGIHERIGGTPTYRPGTRIITALRLNQRGLAVAEQTAVAA